MNSRGVAMRRPVAAAASAVFFLAVPGTVVALIPWLLTRWRVLTPTRYWAPLRVVGAILLAGGLSVMVQATARFVTEGRGTPLPVAAPDRLVVGGHYRYVRNPMYMAVLSAIGGQGLLLGQLRLLLYSAGFGAFVTSYVRWVEEPGLVRRFGADYEAYQRAVPAWLPRLRPWTPGEHNEPGVR
jgi:protein-S-isoprenylcysteine O-methyltransferase Ste14